MSFSVKGIEVHDEAENCLVWFLGDVGFFCVNSVIKKNTVSGLAETWQFKSPTIVSHLLRVTLAELRKNSC